MAEPSEIVKIRRSLFDQLIKKLQLLKQSVTKIKKHKNKYRQ